MSLIHWSRSLGIRAVCGKAKGSESYQGTAQQYLGVSNFCRVCEKIAKQDVDAQKMLAGLGTGKAQLAIVQQWPEPRPIAEAPKDGTRILGWDERYESWKTVSYSALHDAWIDEDGATYMIGWFLPLPPAPEVRK